MTKHMLVFMTASDEEAGATIAKGLVEEKLAACVNIIPQVRSIYRWKGEVYDEKEVMLVAKTASTLAPAIVRRVRELHSYDLPEVICLPIATGSGEYLDWIDQSLDLPSESDEEGEL